MKIYFKSILKSFKSLNMSNIFSQAEISYKISTTKKSSKRFHYYAYNDQCIKSTAIILNVFKEIEQQNGINFNYDLFDQFCKKLDFTKVFQVGVGVDIQNDFFLSRLKIWFFLDNYPSKAKIAIKLSQQDLSVVRPFVGDVFVVGFDFYFNNKSAIKIYPNIWNGSKPFAGVSCNNETSKVSLLSFDTLKQHCQNIYMCFKGNNRSFHCNPHNPKNFINQFIPYYLQEFIPNNLIPAKQYLKNQISPIHVAFDETDFYNNMIQEITLYCTI